jgi:hypothetical protein
VDPTPKSVHPVDIGSQEKGAYMYAGIVMGGPGLAILMTEDELVGQPVIAEFCLQASQKC